MTRLAWVADPAEAEVALQAGLDGTARRQDDGAVAVTLGSGRILRLHPVDAGTAVRDGLPVLPAGHDGLLLSCEGRLLDAVSPAALARLAAQARARGVPLAGSGGLEPPDAPRLAAAGVAMLLFGRALREGGVLSARCLAAVVTRAAAPGAQDGAPRDRIFVRDLVLAMEIGAYRGERGRRQRVRVSAEAEVDPAGHRAETMADIVSYDLIADAVARLAEQGHVELVETFAEAVAAELLGQPRVALVRVRVEKLDLGPGAVGVEIERRRA